MQVDYTASGQPEAGSNAAPFSANQAFYGSDPNAGPSKVYLNSPQATFSQLPAQDHGDSAYVPSGGNRGVGRGRGRGRGMGVGRGRGRGRGRERGFSSSGAVGTRTSTRTSTRIPGGGNSAAGVGKLKLSLKMGGGGASEAAGGRMMSFLGEYDRELDSNPEEPLEFEEQFILRVPREVAEGRGGEVGLREMIKGKGKGLEGIEFKFLDSRRAAVKVNGVTYSSKLVDLPCIIESQKTHDSRHLFKVADISQMLVVGQQVASEANIPSGAINQDDYIWPHGITPPLRHVRKRRFRKRLSRRMIEVVEEQVEELLKKDAEAESSTYDLIDALPDPDIPDSYYQDYDPNMPWQGYEHGSEFGGSEMYEDPGSAMPSEAQWGEGEEGEEGEEEDGEGEEDDEFDQELAHALMEQLEGNGTGESEDEDGFDEGDADDVDEGGEDDEDEDEDDEETAGKKAKIRQFASEIKQLEVAIEKKRAGFQGGNPIMIKRFEETIAGMQNDINTKAVARQVLVDELEQAKPKGPIREEVSAPDASNGGAVNTLGTGERGVVLGKDYAGDGDGSTPAGGVASQRYSEDEDDLFGEIDDEADASGTEAPETPIPGQMISQQDTPRSQMDVEGESEAEGEAEGDGEGEEDEAEGEEDEGMEGIDEMEAMLAAELGGSDAGVGAERGGEEVSGAELQHRAETLAAIDSMDQQGEQEDIPVPSSPAVQHFPPEFSTREGGVGMRRLVEGAEDDDSGSGSSDDSDD